MGGGSAPFPPAASPVVGDELYFPVAIQDELIQHAREGNPDEVCGMLAGRGNRVERLFRVRNTADEIDASRGVFRDRQSGVITGGQKPVHYYMDPRDQLRVYNEVDDLGLDVVGYYHSHTHTEARPSPTDVRLASVPDTFWVLVSLQDAQHPSVRAWRIDKADPADESGEVVEVPIQV